MVSFGTNLEVCWQGKLLVTKMGDHKTENVNTFICQK